MISAEAREESLPLEAQIRAVERRLAERRQRIGSAAARIGSRARARMSSPGTLAAAFGLGVFIHRSGKENGPSFMTLLNGVYTSSTLVMTLSSWMSPAPETRAGVESHEAPQ